MKSYNNQSGRSMVEILGVLAIVAVLSVGGIAGYSKAMAKFKIGKTLDQVSTLVTEIRSLYSGSNEYQGISVTSLITYQIIPNEMIVDANNAKNVFGTPILIGPWDGGVAGSNVGFEIIYNGLSKNTCIQLATADWGGSAASSFVGMQITGASIALNTNLASEFSWLNGNYPLNMVTAGAECADDVDNSISWIYR